MVQHDTLRPHTTRDGWTAHHIVFSTGTWLDMVAPAGDGDSIRLSASDVGVR
jgi:hypothetical protein